MKRKQTVIHDFYCMNCGKKAIPLARAASMRHSKHHRKQMYCIWCKETVNMIECRNDEEVFEFKENFEKGLYKDEAKDSIDYCRGAGIR